MSTTSNDCDANNTFVCILYGTNLSNIQVLVQKAEDATPLVPTLLINTNESYSVPLRKSIFSRLQLEHTFLTSTHLLRRHIVHRPENSEEFDVAVVMELVPTTCDVGAIALPSRFEWMSLQAVLSNPCRVGLNSSIAEILRSTCNANNNDNKWGQCGFYTGVVSKVKHELARRRIIDVSANARQIYCCD